MMDSVEMCAGAREGAGEHRMCLGAMSLEGGFSSPHQLSAVTSCRHPTHHPTLWSGTENTLICSCIWPISPALTGGVAWRPLTVTNTSPPSLPTYHHQHWDWIGSCVSATVAVCMCNNMYLITRWMWGEHASETISLPLCAIFIFKRFFLFAKCPVQGPPY